MSGQFYCLFSQGTWTQKANFGGAPRYAAVGFSIGTKGYIGTGAAHWLGPFYNDFWEWDQATNLWTQKANYGGIPKGAAIGFSIGSKGYIGTGSTDLTPSSLCYSDFWEYDPTTNVWTQKTNFGGTARSFSIGFTIGNKGYVGTGYDGTNRNDFWEYDPVSNTWTQKANFAGAGRCVSFGYSICNKGYVGTGWGGGSQHYNDFWEYNPTTNLWTQKANFTSTLKAECVGFAIGGYLYVGTGTPKVGSGPDLSDFWKYDPSANTWLQMANFGGGPREVAVGFSIGSYGYVGTGWVDDVPSSVKNDFWEFHDPANTGSPAVSIACTNTIICSGQSATIMASGGSAYSWSTGSSNSIISVSPTASTSYSVIVSGSCGVATATMMITVSSPITASISGSTTICSGQTISLSAAGGWNYSWNTNATTSSVSVSPTATSTYSVIVSVGSCSDTASASVTVLQNPNASAGNNVTITQGQSTTLSASGGGTYIWDNGSTASSITVTPANTSIYCVTVTDSNNCNNTKCVTIFLEPPTYCGELFIPNAFSPNDDLDNDLFKADINNLSCIKTFLLVIYNRWGEKVFETNDITHSWDGKYMGKTEGTAVFAYYLEAEYFSGKKEKRKGNISLLR